MEINIGAIQRFRSRSNKTWKNADMNDSLLN
jgi:hypothetical protein